MLIPGQYLVRSNGLYCMRVEGCTPRPDGSFRISATRFDVSNGVPQHTGYLPLFGLNLKPEGKWFIEADLEYEDDEPDRYSVFAGEPVQIGLFG